MTAKRKIRSITCATMILACGGLSAFAQNVSDSDVNRKIISEHESDRPDMPPPDFARCEKKDSDWTKPDFVEGLIRSEGEDANRIFKIDTEQGKSYVLNLFNLERSPNRPDCDPKELYCSDKKLSKKQLKAKAMSASKRSPEESRRPEPVTVKTLEALLGKKAKVIGILNKETNVLTIIAADNNERPRS